MNIIKFNKCPGESIYVFIFLLLALITKPQVHLITVRNVILSAVSTVTLLLFSLLCFSYSYSFQAFCAVICLCNIQKVFVFFCCIKKDLRFVCSVFHPY